MAYIQGESRCQTSLFPVSLEELIPEDNLVRVIDLYVAKLDLGQLGFEKAQPKATGRPAYDPADQLKCRDGSPISYPTSGRIICKAKKNLEIRIFMGLPDFRNGGSCGIRTYDQLVKSQLVETLRQDPA